MSTDLATRAQLSKLARALDVPDDDVAFLASLDPSDIHELREAIIGALHDRHRDLYQRVALASKLLPTGLCVQIAERTFPPVITAKIAAEISTDRVGDYATRLSVDYMADVCINIDPRRVRGLITHVPVERATDVALELVNRDEYVTLGRMIDAATEELVRTVAAQIESDEPLLWIGFYAESVPRLTSAVQAISWERARSLVHTALTGTAELQAACLALICRMDDDRLRGRLADYATEETQETLNALVVTALRDGFVPELITVAASMSEQSLHRLGELPALADTDIVTALVGEADRAGYRERLLSLTEYLPRVVGNTVTETDFAGP